MAEQKLSILLEAKDQASKVIQSAGSAIKDNLGKISGVAAVAAAGIAAFGKSSVDAYVEAETAQRQLEHAVIAVSGGNMQQVQAINAVTSALQVKAGIDADALNMGAAQLSTFGLQSQSVVDLTKSLADYTVNQAGVTAGSGDYINSANTIAKALNGQFGALEKTGVRFTETQQNAILYGTETEKVAAIQEGLNQNLRETTDTVAGTAEAMQGSLVQSMGEVQEQIGKALLPAFMSLMESLTPVITSISEWAAENPELIATIIKVVGAITAAIAVLYPLSVAIGVVSTALAFLAANPIVLVIAAIVALGAAIYLLITHWDEVKAKALEVWNSMKEFIASAAAAIGEKIKAFGNLIKETIQSGMDAVKGIWEGAWNAMTAFIDGIVGGITGTINKIVDAVKGAIQWVKDLISSQDAAAAGSSKLGGGSKSAPSKSSKSGSSKKAGGGNVYAGKPYLVGEKGPEGFIPGQSGRIIPNNRMGGGGLNVAVYVSGNTVAGANMNEFATIIGDTLMNQLRTQIKMS